MKLRRSSSAAMVTIALATAAFACEAIVGIEDRSFVVPEPPPPPPDPCVRASPPGRPDMPDDPDDVQPTFVFALQSIDLRAQRSDGTIAGFDLDGVCTCTTLPNSAYDGAPSCESAGEPGDECDEDGGIDNAGARLAAGLGGLGEEVANRLSDPFRCGENTLILLLNGYNGRANDPAVELQIVESTGLREGRADDTANRVVEAGCKLPEDVDDEVSYPPRFDGEDRFSLRPDALEQGAPFYRLRGPRFRGWVANYHVVIDRLDEDERLPVVIFGRVVLASRARLDSPLVPLDERGQPLPLDDRGEVVGGAIPKYFRVEEGVLTGRAEAKDVLSAIATVRSQELGDVALCETPLYDTFRTLVCRAADTKISPREDFLPGRCNALSIGALFKGVSARLSDLEYATPNTPGPCSSQLFSDRCP